MNIQVAIRKFGDKKRREQAHVSRETDEVDFVLVKNGGNLPIVDFAFEALRRNDASLDAAGFGALNAGSAFAIADDDGNLRVGNPSPATLSASASKFEPRPLQSTAIRFFLNEKR